MDAVFFLRKGASGMKEYEVKLGRGAERWASPYDYVAPAPGEGIAPGAFGSIGEALDAPFCSPPLEELARGAKNIAVCVPDVTRAWCRAPEMNAAVRERIARSGTRARVTWIAATGLHRPVLERERAAVFGDSPREGDVRVSHDCGRTTDTGLFTPSGTPVTLAPEFARADLVVLVGGVVFHDMAGFSGGRKTIMPGVSGRRSIVLNHNHCLVDGKPNPLTDSGLIANNPMADDQRAYAELALRGKECFILNAVADMSGRPAAWAAGGLWEAWEAACRACRALDAVYIPEKARRCVVSCGGFPFDMDLYQATKALFSPLGALEKGAPVVLVAGLEDSLGPGDFGQSLRRAMADAAGFAEYLKEAFTVPGYIALRTVLETRGRPAALVTPREGVPFPGRVFRTAREADDWLVAVSGLDGLSLLVPSGNAIHVLARG